MLNRTFPVFILIVAQAVVAVPFSTHAEEQGSTVEGAGYSLFDTESIKGFDAAKVE